MRPTTSDAEDTVRRYLVYLDDPSKLVDQAAVDRQVAHARATEDPIERLHAYAELERMRTVDGAALTDAFVGVALGWASEHSIPVEAFRELGVPDAALEAAGFEVSSQRARGSTRTRGESGVRASRPRRAKRVSSESIQDVMRSFVEPFTVADVVAKTGGSAATARKAAESLCASGELTKRGPDPAHASRGRAPILYVPSG